MALWDKLKTELDRAGRAAQTAFDEGKARLEILRVRQLADKAAQALGYAVYNARRTGNELDEESYARLSSTLAAHEAEISRLEAQLDAERNAAGATAAEPAAGAGATGAAAEGATQQANGPGATASTSPGVDPAQGDLGSAASPNPPGV